MKENNSLTNDETGVGNIFNLQLSYQDSVKNTNSGERIAKLQTLRAAILNFKDEILEAVYKDFNKPHFETLAVEIFALIKKIDEACFNLPEWMKPERVITLSNPAATAEIIYEPRGVVLIIGPWNLPLLLCLSPLIPAIAAGNTAILKPSELTPNVSAIIKKIIDASFNVREVAVIEGGVDITTELLQLPFNHFFFTGSQKVGKIVMKAAADNLASVTLELGGKSPVIIDETADFDKAVARIMKGKTPNSGQICMAPDYAIMPAALVDQFIVKAKAFVEKCYVKNGSFNYDDYGQIINKQNFERLKALFDDAISKGAILAMGGVFDSDSLRILPTILTNVPINAAIMQEEIFGPILPIITLESREEISDYVKKLQKPLAYYVFSESDDNINYFLTHSTSGGVCINDTMVQVYEPNLPLGGINGSGIGSYNSIYGFRELSHRRSVYYQSTDTPVDEFRIPPYAGKIDAVWNMLIENKKS